MKTLTFKENLLARISPRSLERNVHLRMSGFEEKKGG
jgi:hypothetical protein